jgi:hypothetical protein
VTMKQHLGHNRGDDQPELRRLAGAALEPDLHRRWQQLQQTLDLDRFLNFMVMEIMVCHWDGYCLGRNNFWVYHSPGPDKTIFLPTGMDQSFAKSDMPWKPDMAGLVARAIMEIPQGCQQYEARFRTLFRRLFLAERLTNRVNQLLTDLEPFLPRADFARMRREAVELSDQITERERYLQTQLSDLGPGVPEFVNGQAALSGWRIAGAIEERDMHSAADLDGIPTLHISSGPRTAASWRTTVRLNRGSYTLQGNAKVTDVLPLAFGVNQGASLRVGGKPNRSAELMGSTGWERLATSFEVSETEEEIVLICELRASAGQAWFDTNSLRLVRQH